MSTLTILPSSLSLGAVGPGWIRGTPSLGGPQAPNYPAGLRFTPSDIFGDSPPVGSELYLITGFTIAYSTALDDVSAAGNYDIQTQLSIEVAHDTVASALDVQTMSVPAAGNTATVSGVWEADLVNPVAVSPGDRATIQLGANAGGASATGGQVDIGYQTTWDPATTSFVAVNYPSTIRYSIINRAMT